MEANEVVDVVNPSLLDCFEALLVLMSATAGFLINIALFIVIARHHSFKNSFGYITAYHALCRSSILLVFAVWATPWTLFPIPENIHGLNSFLGQISLFFEEIAFHCSLLLALNRFIAIAFPMKYRMWFTNSATFWYLTFITGYASLYWGIYFVGSCDFRFSHDSRVWEFGTEPCSVFLSIYIDMVYNLCLFAVIAIIDVMTIVHLKNLHKEFFFRNSEAGTVNTREKRETLLFVQAFLTSCVYIFMLLCFHLISPHIDRYSEFLYFLSTTFMWEISHTRGGPSVVAFQEDWMSWCKHRVDPYEKIDSIFLLADCSSNRLIPICFNPEIRRQLIAASHFFRFHRDSASAEHVCPVTTVTTSPQKREPTETRAKEG